MSASTANSPAANPSQGSFQQPAAPTASQAVFYEEWLTILKTPWKTCHLLAVIVCIGGLCWWDSWGQTAVRCSTVIAALGVLLCDRLRTLFTFLLLIAAGLTLIVLGVGEILKNDLSIRQASVWIAMVTGVVVIICSGLAAVGRWGDEQ
jgi:hypothetical protein